MSQIQTQRLSQLETLMVGGPLPLAAQVAVGFAVVVTKWSRTYRTRKQLAHLSSHMLNDVGLSEQDAAREATLPFWRS